MKRLFAAGMILSTVAVASPAHARDWTFGLQGWAAGFVGETDQDAEERENTLGADAEIAVFGSTIFNSGLEVGFTAAAAYDEDADERAWAGGRISGNLIGGRRAAFGPGSDFTLNNTSLYALGSFGEVILGRDDGVADILAIAAPNIFSALSVNDWRSDVTGLIDVHTVNDFSGVATKMSYVSPAFSGLKLGLSYTPESRDCIDRVCFTAQRSYLASSDPQIAVASQSDWEDILEVAMYYERALGQNLAVGVGGSYVTARERSGALPNVFDDYESYSVGVNLAYGGFTVGGSYRDSNAGYVASEDNYVAFDAGITYEAGPWGFMVGFGASDSGRDAANPLDAALYRQTKAYQTGVTYMFGAGISVGFAGQFVQSDKPDVIGGDEDAAAIVFESSINF